MTVSNKKPLSCNFFLISSVDMEVPIDDLLSPMPATRGSPRNKGPNNHLRPISSHPHTSRVDADSEAASSMRMSVLTRNLNSRRGPTSVKDNASTHSSASSIRSARSTATTSSAASDSTIGRSSRADTVNTGMSPARRIVEATRAKDTLKERPDSKLTPASPTTPTTNLEEFSSPIQPSINFPRDGDGDNVEEDVDQKSITSDVGGSPQDEDDRESIASSEAPTEPDSASSTPVKKTVITRASLASVASRVSASPSINPNPSRNKTSSASLRSQASSARKPTVSVTGRQSLGKSTTSSVTRPVSRGSTRASTASTLSRSSATRSTSTSSSRPASSVSSTSTASTSNNRSSTITTESTTSYRTASSGLSTPQARSRKSSAASNASARTAGPGRTSPVSPRVRTVSGASVSSVTSTVSSSAYGTAKSSVSKAAPPPPLPSVDPTKLSPAAAKARQLSLRSVRSASSIKKAAATSGGRKSSAPSSQKASPTSSALASPAETKPPKPLPAHDKENRGDETHDDELNNTTSTITIKPRPHSAETNANEHKKTDSTASSGSNATIKKKRSNEVITTDGGPPASSTTTSRNSGGSIDQPRRRDKPQPPLPAATEKENLPPALPTDGTPRGASLDIGIPCIVSSKRKRFKAYARYIGEVEGEYGPWVGVEVPIPLGESWSDRDIDSGWQGTQWNDGTLGGIRYFEMGNKGTDWDYAYDDRATRRRRVDGGSSVSIWSKDKGGLKREGDQLTMGMERMKRMRSVSPAVSDSSGAESRGLFVRPQQVLYVVDAVEDL